LNKFNLLSVISFVLTISIDQTHTKASLTSQNKHQEQETLCLRASFKNGSF